MFLHPATDQKRSKTYFSEKRKKKHERERKGGGSSHLGSIICSSTCGVKIKGKDEANRAPPQQAGEGEDKAIEERKEKTKK